MCVVAHARRRRWLRVHLSAHERCPLRETGAGFVLGIGPGLPVVSLLPALGDRRPQGGELRAQRLDLSRLLPSPSLERLDSQQVDAIDVRGRDGRVALAEAERGPEVLCGGAEVAARSGLRPVVPLPDRHPRDPPKYALPIDLAEVLLAPDIRDASPGAGARREGDAGGKVRAGVEDRAT